MMGIREIVETYGVKNIRVFMGMKPSTNRFMMGAELPYNVVECEIVETRYKVSEGYKVALSPVEQPAHGDYRYVEEHFYQTDFDNLRRENPDDYRIYILVDEDGKYERLRDQALKAA